MNIITTDPENEAQNARELITKKLQRLTEVEALISNVTTEQQAKVQTIVSATKEVLEPYVAERAKLKASIEALAADHHAALFKGKKSVDLDTHILAFRASTAITCEDEAAAVNMLETLLEDPKSSESDQISAKACLRYETPGLDKSFIKKHWKKHAAWFRSFGFCLRIKQSFSITAKETPAIPEA